MAELLLIGTALLTFGAFAFGSLLTERLDRSMWRRDGYCPTCDRLRDEDDGAAEVIARVDALAEWWEAHTQFAAPRYVGEQFRRAARGEQTTDQIIRAARNGGGSDV